MSQWIKYVHMVVPTSCAPWHPSTGIIEQMFASVRRLLGCLPAVSIYCDYPQDWTTSEERDRYWTFISRLRRLGIGEVIQLDRWVGLVGIHKRMQEDIHSDIIFNCQRDWIFHRPERIDIDQVLYLLKHNPGVQMIRFSKSPLSPRGRRVDKRLVQWEVSRLGIPLISTNGWADSPHFASRAHYETHVYPALADDHGADGSYGVEVPILMRYRKDVASYGFSAAHQQWGVFLYGEFGEEEYIRHIGAKATEWRMNRRIRRPSVRWQDL